MKSLVVSIAVGYVFLISGSSVSAQLEPGVESGGPLPLLVGEIGSLEFHVDGQLVQPVMDNEIQYHSPATINMNAICYCEVPAIYGGPATFHCTWTLSNQSTSWSPTLQPGTGQQEQQGLGIVDLAMGDHAVSVTITGDLVILAHEEYTFIDLDQ